MNTNPVIHPNEVVKLKSVEIGNALKLAIIAGPCQLESRAHAFDMAGALKEICQKMDVGLVYKTSFDKANRTSANSERGLGLERALPIFAPTSRTYAIRWKPRPESRSTDARGGIPCRRMMRARRFGACRLKSFPTPYDRSPASGDRWRRAMPRRRLGPVTGGWSRAL